MINEDILNLLDNDGKLLYVLKMLGPLRFEEIVNVMNPYETFQEERQKKRGRKPKNVEKEDLWKGGLGHRSRHQMSRGTVSRHLKRLKDPNINYVTQISELDQETMRNVQKYTLTPRGRGFINKIIKEEDSPVRPDLYGMIYHKITEFYKERGFEKQTTLTDIINMIGRIDQEKFFRLPQTDDMYNTLFFIFQNMLEKSINKDSLSFFELDNFSQTYNVSKKQIEANLEKILEADLGYYQIDWENTYLFFQKKDPIGSIIFSYIQNSIESEIIKRSLDVKNLRDFKDIAKDVSENLVDSNLIRPHLQLYLQRFLNCLLILYTIDRGLTRTELVEFWPEFKKLLSKKEGIDLSITIFGPATEYRKLEELTKFIPLPQTDSEA